MSTTRFFLASTTALLIACEQPAPTSAPKTQQSAVPNITSYESKEWSATGPKDKVVARVNGAAITQSTLKAQIEAYPEVPVSELLNALIEFEVLAQQAEKSDSSASAGAILARRQALVRSYLDDIFEKEVVPESYPMERVRKDYILNRKRYWFKADAWRAAHVHETCCDPKQNNCDTKEARDCFMESEARLFGVYEGLKKKIGNTRDPAQVDKAFADYRSEIGDLNPNLRYEKFSFFYDPTKDHQWHFGKYSVYDEAVVRSVMAGEKGVIQKPVQSQFGWHVMVKLDHRPAMQKTADDPWVIADIRKRVFPRYQKYRFHKQVDDLYKRFEVQIDPTGIEALDAL